MRPDTLDRLRFLPAIAVALLAAVSPARAADPGDEFWAPAYAPAGIQGEVLTMVSHTGVLYVGGRFNAIGDLPIRHIAALSTGGSPDLAVTGVVPLGDGLDDHVYDLCDHDGGLVAVGKFVTSGALTVEHVARWDGVAWQDMGGGLPGSVPRAVASFQGDLYAGGMRWDGAAWENVMQTNGTVTSLEVRDGLLHVGGSFTEARGQAVAYLFAWDGNGIVTLGDGFPYPVKAMTAAADGLYAAGGDDDTGNALLSRWDGADWHDESPGGWVDHLATYDGDVYASTILPTAPHHPDYVLQAKAGGAWQTVTDVWPTAMLEHDGLLMVQAAPGDVDGLLTPGLAAWNGTGLQDVFLPPAGYSTGFRTMAPYGAGLIVGGSYTIADGQRIEGSALLVGGTWFPAGSPSDIPSGYPATLEQLVTVGTTAFGVYNWIDWDIGVEVLAKLVWDVDRFRWQALDTPDGHAGVLQTVGTQLYSLGGNHVRLIDPATGVFTDLTPFVVNGGVSGSCEADGVLTICGTFSTINGQPVSNVARYVGGSWQGVGDPLPGYQVKAVTGLDGSRLAVATWVGSVHQVWAFDGVAWSRLPGDFNGRVDHLAYHRGRLFAAGTFDQVGSVAASGVAVWTGELWAPVGSGLVGPSYNAVTDMVSVGDNIHFAGAFYRAGGLASAGFAQWSGDPTLITGGVSAVPDAAEGPGLLEAARPNPFNPRTEIAFTAPGQGQVTLGIYDLRGRCVRRLVDEAMDGGRHLRSWDGRDDAGRSLPSGIYFARISAAGRTESEKLTLVR